MNSQDLNKLPFYPVYYYAQPLQANEDLKLLFQDAAKIADEKMAKEVFLFFINRARKYGIRLFFKAPEKFFNSSIADVFEDGYTTPETVIPYKGLPDFAISERMN